MKIYYIIILCCMTYTIWITMGATLFMGTEGFYDWILDYYKKNSLNGFTLFQSSKELILWPWYLYMFIRDRRVKP